MIEIENASFAFSPGNPLFRNLSFRLEAGQTLAVLGPNGVGKTTLLRCIMGFLPLTSGRVKLDGREVREIGQAKFWKLVSYVPQARSVVFGYSVKTMVVMGRSSYIQKGRTPGAEDYREAENLLAEFGISELADRSCNSLSGGQLQLVLIARALAKSPQILIMDEPESNLDMKNQLRVLDVIERLAHEKNITIILNTHFPAHALREADKTLLLGTHGHVFDKTGGVVSQDNIRRYFGVDAELIQVPGRWGTVAGIVPISIAES